MSDLDPELLSHAREMAVHLSDAQLARELDGDRSAIQPEAWKALEEEAQRRARPAKPPILATTHALPMPIRRVLGVIGSEYVMGVDLIQEFLAGVRDIVGGRSATIQGAFHTARQVLLHELSEKGKELRADAVLGITFNLSEWSGQNKSMLVLLVSGTAVELDTEQRPDA